MAAGTGTGADADADADGIFVSVRNWVGEVIGNCWYAGGESVEKKVFSLLEWVVLIVSAAASLESEGKVACASRGAAASLLLLPKRRLCFAIVSKAQRSTCGGGIVDSNVVEVLGCRDVLVRRWIRFPCRRSEVGGRIDRVGQLRCGRCVFSPLQIR